MATGIISRQSTRRNTLFGILSAALAAAATASPFPEGPGREILLHRCTHCHAPDLVTTYRRTLVEWEENILLMNDLGGATTEEELSVLAAYLAKHWGRDQTSPSPPHSNPHAHEPIGTVREIYDGTLTPELAVSTFRNIDRLFAVRSVQPAIEPRPLPPAERPLSEVRLTADGLTYALEDYLELNRIAAILVIKDGRVMIERYRLGNGPGTRWMSMSVVKSITSTLIGAALQEGAIGSLDDPVTRYVPSLAGSAYDGVTIRQVLTMTSGVAWDETYTDPESDRRRLLEAQIEQQPGALLEVMRRLPPAALPGTHFNYSTGETQIAAEIIRGATGLSLSEYLSERIWSRFGMESEAWWWLDSPDGTEIGGSGFSATLRDYGRFGLFLLNGGVADAEAILPQSWMHEATQPHRLPDGRAVEYGYLWWTAETPLARQNGAFTAEGIHGQFLHIDPAAGVVIVVWGARPEPLGGEVIDDRQFLDAIVETASG